MAKERVLKRVGVDELPKYTPWVARILGLDPFSKPVRDLAKIDTQYDKDIYAKLLVYAKKHPGANPTDIRRQEVQREPNTTVCFSKKGKLYLTSAADLQRLSDKVLVDVLAEPLSRTRVVVELGCGYGYNLSVLRNFFPNHVWIGGEYSKNAMELASQLFAACEGISVVPFNWYDSTWVVLEGLVEKAVVFTKFSVNELPQAVSIIPIFAKYKSKISEVIHLEPVYELTDNHSTLGLMRRAYTLLNDYNTDLLTTLTGMRAVQILKTEYDLIGANPLYPTSLVWWRFTEE
jgi:trans-aconitate methyltransferase